MSGAHKTELKPINPNFVKLKNVMHRTKNAFFSTFVLAIASSVF
jgi:hypothetical protein